jgi:hypothetical protein
VTFPSFLSTRNRLSLHDRGPAIEDEDRSDPKVQQLAYPTKESDDVGISERISFFVSDRFKELVNPNRRVDRKPSLVERLEFDGTSAGLHDRPKAGNTHRRSKGCQIMNR